MVREEASGVRQLILDPSGRLQSVRCPWDPFTHGVWDLFALAPAIVPPGPVGLLGLGAGSVVHLYRALWPGRRLVAWELDPEVVEVAGTHFEVSPGPDLEVRVGDALAAEDGGYAALLVDLFLDGALPPALEQPETWAALRARLLPGGRVLANLGGPTARGVASLAAFGAGVARELDAGNLFAISGAQPAWGDDLPVGLAAHRAGWKDLGGPIPLLQPEPPR